jgi:hypothetical protein
MVISRSVLFLCLSLTAASAQQWRVVVPAYLNPVQFFDGSAQVVDGPYLTGYSCVWSAAASNGVVRISSMVCGQPTENMLALGRGLPGPNWLTIAASYSDGTVLNLSNCMTFAGLELFATDGRAKLVYRVKAHLTDYTWTVVTNNNPAWLLLNAGEQYFDLRTNKISAIFFVDSLPGEGPTNTPTTQTGQSLPPMP